MVRAFLNGKEIDLGPDARIVVKPGVDVYTCEIGEAQRALIERDRRFERIAGVYDFVLEPQRGMVRVRARRASSLVFDQRRRGR